MIILTSTDDLISKISEKDFDLDKFVEITLNDNKVRDFIVDQMLNNNNIMVYYHSYYIISYASEISPELFYKYWDDFATLLNHKNSYHRDFGLTLIANLTEVDKENRFLSIFDNYFKHLDDAKFMTARHCVQNTAKILANKEELRDNIINILLDVDKLCDFPQKQKSLLKSDVIEVFDGIYKEIKDKDKIIEFVNAQLNSISPKTKKKAKEFILKHDS